MSWHPAYSSAMVWPDGGGPGSGFLLGEKDGTWLMVTARHVIASHDVEVWFHGDLYDRDGKYTAPTRGQGRGAEPHWESETLDVAVVAVERKKVDPERAPAAPLPYESLRVGDGCSARVFPDFAANQQHPTERAAATLDGSIADARDGSFELEISDRSMRDLGGCSGGAVMVGPMPAGVIVQREENDDPKLIVVPIDRLRDEPDFPDVWNPGQVERWQRNLAQQIRELLRADETLANDLREIFAAFDDAGEPLDSLTTARPPEHVLPPMTALMERYASDIPKPTDRATRLLQILCLTAPWCYHALMGRITRDEKGRTKIPMQFGFPEAAAVAAAAIDKSRADLELIERDGKPQVRTRSVIPFPSARPGLPAIGMSADEHRTHLEQEMVARMARLESDTSADVTSDVTARVERARKAHRSGKEGGWRPSLLVDGREDGFINETVEQFVKEFDARVLLADSGSAPEANTRERCIDDFIRAYVRLQS